MQISADIENCTGCLRCALACSFFTSGQKAFNPIQSKIQISPVVNGEGFEIAFTPECNECGICVKHCAFGALNNNGSSNE